ncbi:nuclear receptor coactivator 5 [Thalassophryne amazonica]|uniref:nuclear receptor coactivator 5 n=1 Tax=Thalassophryne amazonica TaxID=390379 RepID=UPI0014715CDD|nr:nuclear receptor coactivator 5 [Thalassophryne amazonica]
MSSWATSSGALRLSQGSPNGSAQQQRLLRRSAPYPAREARSEEHKKDALNSYEELEQMQNYSGTVKYEGQKQQNAKPESSNPSERRKSLYQKFYRQVQEERKPADCVVLSTANQCLDYPKSLGQCLQERSLSVEMFYLQAESGLTRALQDIRSAGSPFCILVEQKNIALSSCTVIIFSESLKIHRNMPKDQAMDFAVAEYNRALAKERPPRDPADIAAQASQLLDDFLDREKLERHTVPSDTRQLLFLLAEGVHLYPEELDTVSEYVRSRLDHAQATNTKGEKGNALPRSLGKPPPLLPTPPGPPQLLCATDAADDLLGLEDSLPQPSPLLPLPGSHPKSKPPPLLSLHHTPVSVLGAGGPHGLPTPRGPLSSHYPYGVAAALRGPLLQHPPLYFAGPRGPYGFRGAPPSLKSARPPLLPSPGGPLLHPGAPRF